MKNRILLLSQNENFVELAIEWLKSQADITFIATDEKENRFDIVKSFFEINDNSNIKFDALEKLKLSFQILPELDDFTHPISLPLLPNSNENMVFHDINGNYSLRIARIDNSDNISKKHPLNFFDLGISKFNDIENPIELFEVTRFEDILNIIGYLKYKFLVEKSINNSIIKHELMLPTTIRVMYTLQNELGYYINSDFETTIQFNEALTFDTPDEIETFVNEYRGELELEDYAIKEVTIISKLLKS